MKGKSSKEQGDYYCPRCKQQVDNPRWSRDYNISYCPKCDCPCRFDPLLTDVELIERDSKQKQAVE